MVECDARCSRNPTVALQRLLVVAVAQRERWSFAQFVGFSEKVQIMQDKNYRVLAAFMGLVWFCIPVVLELLWLETVADAKDPWWRLIGIWASFFLWPFSGLCCFNAFVDAKRRSGDWSIMFVVPFVVCLPVVVIGGFLIALCIAALRWFGFL